MILKDKVVLISEVRNEIDIAAGIWLAELGAEVVVICSEPYMVSSLKNDFLKDHQQLKFKLIAADLLRSPEVDILAMEWIWPFPLTHVDIWMNDASSIFIDRSLDKDDSDGFYRTTKNTFLLVSLLIDLFNETPYGGLLSVRTFFNLDFDFNSIAPTSHRDYFDLYNLSKLENILFSYELSDRLKNPIIASSFAKDALVLPKLFTLLGDGIPFLF